MLSVGAALLLGVAGMGSAQPDEAAAGTNLLAAGDFEAEDVFAAQWRALNTASQGRFALDQAAPHGGASCLRIEVPAETRGGQPRGVVYRVEPAPAGRKVRLSAWVRTEDVTPPAGAGVCVQGCDAGAECVAFFTTQSTEGLARGEEWTRIQTESAVPPEVHHLLVMAFLSGSGTAWLDDLELVDVGPADPADLEAARIPKRIEGPALALAQGRFRFEAQQEAEGFRVWVPLPLCFEDQVPLGLRIQVEPAERLEGYTLRERLPGDWMAELRLAKLPAGRWADITCEVPVLLRAHDYTSVPAEIPYPDADALPAEVRPWLAATRCVQADDPAIRERARQLREAAPDLLAFARAAVQVPGEAPAGTMPPALDAVAALSAQGSCTSNANLVAALMRAAGISARVLAGYPTWSPPLQTHYVVEFWAGEQGWVWAESSLGVVPCPSPYQVQVAIVYPEDEDRSFRDFGGEEPHVRAAMDGVPWMSLTEFGPPRAVRMVGMVGPKDRNCDHQAVVLAQISADDPDLEAAFEAATAFWPAYRAVRAEGRDLPEVAACVKAMEQAKTGAELLRHLAEAADRLQPAPTPRP